MSGVKLGGHESDLTIPECGLAMIHYAVTSIHCDDHDHPYTTHKVQSEVYNVQAYAKRHDHPYTTHKAQRSTTYKPMRSGTSAVLSTRQSTRSYKYSRRNSEPESTPHPCLHRMHLGCAQRRSSLPRAAS